MSGRTDDCEKNMSLILFFGNHEFYAENVSVFMQI